jgi:PAT family beta-lactamase induction signal transducer AmpG
MSEANRLGRPALSWIPSLYLAEGLPYVVVMTVSVIMYKGLGISNTDIALFTSWLYLPWVIKPLWSPVVDLLGTRRRWIWTMQLLIGGGLAGVALALPLPSAFAWTFAFFWLLAFNSATHDIAADGFYMLALTPSSQAMYVGVRTMFYRIAMIAGQGLLVMLAGELQERSNDVAYAWSVTMGVLAVLFVLFGIWHAAVLPRPDADRRGEARHIPHFLREFLGTFGSFFRKPRIAALLSFLLLYRLAEAQLVKMAAPFLLDPQAEGGLGLSTTQVGFVYGTLGLVALTAGGVLGGWVASRHGLGRWLWPMMFAIHLPDAVYVYLAYAQPTQLALIQGCVVIEQFGYGFGFTAYVLYMMYVARGERQTAHYAICTGFMALGMMLPGMWSGWLQEQVGYRQFFNLVMLSTIPTFVVALFIPLEKSFGRKGAH